MLLKKTNNCEDCCLKMFEEWCESFPNHTWNDLITALKSKSVRKDAVASRIADKIGMM